MKTLQVTSKDNTFKIYAADEPFGEIIFENTTHAELKLENKSYHTSTNENKDIVLNENSKSLFTFKFDKLWGGAEIINSENYEGLEIKGRWFKIGTRLIDENDNDLVVVVNEKEGYLVTINDEAVSPLMIISTIYYHIYASRMKLLSAIIQ